MLFAQPTAPNDQSLRVVMLGRVRVRDPLTGATEETGTLMFRVTTSDLAPRLLPGDFAEIDPRALSPDPGKFALFNEPNGVLATSRKDNPPQSCSINAAGLIKGGSR